MFPGHDAAGGAREVARGASCSRSGCRSSSRTRASKDDDPRDVPERHAARPARLVRRSSASPEASRLFFGKDVSNVTLAEAATIAGVFQSPSALSPFNNPARCKERRNVVLQAMVDAGYVTQDAADRAVHEPLVVVQRALEAEAPYFVDFVGQTLAEQYPGLTTTTTQAVDVYTTLDLHLQRLAQDAVRDGLTQVDSCCARRKRRARRRRRSSPSIRGPARFSRSSAAARTTSRSTTARSSSRRQPGSVFKPFVYLTAFEQARGARPHRRHAGVDHQRRAGDLRVRRSGVDAGELRERPTTARSPSATRSRIRATSARFTSRRRPATTASRRSGRSSASARRRSRIRRSRSACSRRRRTKSPRRTRSFPNGGVIRPLQHILRITSGGKDVTKKHARPSRARSRGRDTTFLVTNMMRSVLNEGTGGERARGRVHARRRRQDRHDQRSARRLVRRLHAGAADGRLGRLRRQPAGRPERRAGGAADLDAVHEARARRPRQRAVRRARRHHLRRHRRRHRQARRRPTARR